jgi:transcriptional regulator with XRE-family HTH domain
LHLSCVYQWGEMDTATRILKWREFAGLSRAELAKTVDVSLQAVKYWENGAHPPTLANLEKIVSACGISMGEFWGPIPGIKRRPL